MHELLFMAMKERLPANLAHKIKQIDFSGVVGARNEWMCVELGKHIEISDFIHIEWES